MNDFIITTIIPTYRRPQLLRRAIESVLQQTVKNSIIYVSDNASGDETRSVVEEYCKKYDRVHYFCHPNNIGPAQNFAKAVDHLQTPYFSFLQDDDYLLPWFYEAALDGFNKYPSAGFSACRTFIVNAKGKLIPSQFTLPVLSGFFSVPDSVFAVLKTPLAPALWNAVLFKKEVIEMVGGPDAIAGTATDFNFIVKCACSFPFVITSKPAAVLVVWPKSITFSQSDCHSDNLDIVFNNVEKYLQAPENIKKNIFLRLRQLEKLGKKHIWIRLLLAEKIEAAKSAKRAFFSCGGSISVVFFKILTWSEKSRFFRKNLRFLLFFRNQLYSLVAWFTIKKDPERKLYKYWVKEHLWNLKTRKPLPGEPIRKCAKYLG